MMMVAATTPTVLILTIALSTLSWYNHGVVVASAFLTAPPSWRTSIAIGIGDYNSVRCRSKRRCTAIFDRRDTTNISHDNGYYYNNNNDDDDGFNINNNNSQRGYNEDDVNNIVNYNHNRRTGSGSRQQPQQQPIFGRGGHYHNYQGAGSEDFRKVSRGGNRSNSNRHHNSNSNSNINRRDTDYDHNDGWIQNQFNNVNPEYERYQEPQPPHQHQHHTNHGNGSGWQNQNQNNNNNNHNSIINQYQNRIKRVGGPSEDFRQGGSASSQTTEKRRRPNDHHHHDYQTRRRPMTVRLPQLPSHQQQQQQQQHDSPFENIGPSEWYFDNELQYEIQRSIHNNSPPQNSSSGSSRNNLRDARVSSHDDYLLDTDDNERRSWEKQYHDDLREYESQRSSGLGRDFRNGNTLQGDITALGHEAGESLRSAWENIANVLKGM